MKIINDYQEYSAIVAKYNLKSCLSNDYIQREAADLIINKALYADCYERNAFLFVKKDVVFRVYFYVNDQSELADFSGYNDLVIELLFRGEVPQDAIDFLKKCGFQQNIILDQYAATYKELAENIDDSHSVYVGKAQSLETVKRSCELFNKSFDRLSGDYMSANQYECLLASGGILAAWNNENKQHFLGALHQTKNGNVNTIGHLVVMPHARGTGVSKALIDYFVESNKNPERTEKTRYQVWVRRDNVPAEKMYKKKGFKYINKSTISLIKL